MHSNEPDLKELKVIERRLMKGESTNDNVKKLEVLGKQIKRHEDARDKLREEKKAEIADTHNDKGQKQKDG